MASELHLKACPTRGIPSQRRLAYEFWPHPRLVQLPRATAPGLRLRSRIYRCPRCYLHMALSRIAQFSAVSCLQTPSLYRPNSAGSAIGASTGRAACAGEGFPALAQCDSTCLPLLRPACRSHALRGRAARPALAQESDTHSTGRAQGATPSAAVSSAARVPLDTSA